jgi:methionine-rich copper-binding protein CopC
MGQREFITIIGSAAAGCHVLSANTHTTKGSFTFSVGGQ